MKRDIVDEGDERALAHEKMVREIADGWKGQSR
jgi:hypothetical protein